MTIKYKIKDDDKRIKLFGSDFIKNNKDKCYIIIDNKKTELKEYIENIKQNKIEIKLYETGIITNMSYMFSGCNSLNSLPDISKWDTKNVTTMNHMFCGCNSLNSLPDISKWDTKNVTKMGFMFCGCKSLNSLPDISKWVLNSNLSKDNMFDGVNKKIIPKKFK